MTGHAESMIMALRARLATPFPITEALAACEARMATRQPGLGALVIRLYNADLDPGWLSRLRFCTRLIVATTAIRLGMKAATRQRLMAGLRQLQAELDRLPPPRAAHLRHLQHPLAACHLAMWSRTARREMYPPPRRDAPSSLSHGVTPHSAAQLFPPRRQPR